MIPPKKAAVIGAGGIGCTLIPILSRLMDVVIVDGDSYEPGNAERQFPAHTSTKNKAIALSEMTSNAIHSVQFIPEYLQDASILNWKEWDGVDIIFGAVDNNKSRRIIATLASELGLPAILAGNEHVHGDAHLVLPGYYNPFDHFAFEDKEPPPWSCTHTKTIEEFPQTPMANIMAAGCALHILLSFRQATSPHNIIAHSLSDAFNSSSSRIKDLIRKKEQEESTPTS